MGFVVNVRGMLLDIDDYEDLSPNWGIYKGYAQFTTGKQEFVARWIAKRMHGHIPHGMVVDHINGNPLDNRRKNLQITSQRINILKSKPKKQKSSTGYRRVYRATSGKPYRVMFQVDGKTQTFGRFDSAEEAAFHADVWAYRILPEHTTLNFPNRINEIREAALKLVTMWEWQRVP